MAVGLAGWMGLFVGGAGYFFAAAAAAVAVSC